MKSVEPIRDLKTIKNMRAVLKSQSTRNELLFILGINVGLRISDILKLKFGDIVNFKNMKVLDHVIIKEKKTGKTKKFYIGSIVKKLIENYIKELGEVSSEDYIFKSNKGENKPISRQHAWFILNTAAEIIGLVQRDEFGRIIQGEIGTHTMRKTFGYHAYKNGTSLELLMDIFNHSCKSETLRYIGITEEEKRMVYLKSNLG
ncbi:MULTISPECIES: tyrosine-type recombinase/integrase [Clostridium]|jgi:integrase|uniref:tyrosine-type recombinase/integrase n=1 Tax=Clostridium TaxID=1485 RepID=UPI00242FC9D4|nr:tyrosine-type recombinase/integrase [Clostridium tyrobutyricum]